MSIFSGVCWLSGCLFWRKVFYVFCPFLNWIAFWVLRFTRVTSMAIKQPPGEIDNGNPRSLNLRGGLRCSYLWLCSLYILDTNPLSDMSFADIFFHLVGCHLVLLIISFVVQKLFFFWCSYNSVCCLCFPCLRRPI